MQRFFTADSHAFHRLMAAERGFSSVELMNEWMANSINKEVGPNDLLYHLGDFALGPIQNAVQFRSMLNVKHIVLLSGNHDFRYRSKIEFVRLFDKLEDLLIVRAGKIPVVLCHYPLESWPQKHYGSWHFHGHCHGKLKQTDRRVDVGIDVQTRPKYLEDLINGGSAIIRTSADYPEQT